MADDKWIKVVSKLNALTQDGKLTWEGPIELPTVGNSRTLAYVAKYKDRRIRVRKWGSTDFRLAIVDQDNAVLYSIPQVPGISDLYDSIAYQKAGVKEFIDDLLKEE